MVRQPRDGTLFLRIETGCPAVHTGGVPARALRPHEPFRRHGAGTVSLPRGLRRIRVSSDSGSPTRIGTPPAAVRKGKKTHSVDLDLVRARIRLRLWSLRESDGPRTDPVRAQRPRRRGRTHRLLLRRPHPVAAVVGRSEPALAGREPGSFHGTRRPQGDLIWNISGNPSTNKRTGGSDCGQRVKGKGRGGPAFRRFLDEPDLMEGVEACTLECSPTSERRIR